MSKKNYVYELITNDELEQVVVQADTLKELSSKCRYTYTYIKYLYLGFYSSNKFKVVKVVFDDVED